MHVFGSSSAYKYINFSKPIYNGFCWIAEELLSLFVVTRQGTGLICDEGIVNLCTHTHTHKHLILLQLSSLPTSLQLCTPGIETLDYCSLLRKVKK